MSERFPDNLPEGWRKALGAENDKPYFKNLSRFLNTELKKNQTVFPDRKHILRALQSVDLPDVKVVILGQDPYHGPGQAIGLSFAVPNEHKPKPPSLVNIFKEIETDLGKQVDRNHSELSQWTAQGVLLLNTVLTVRKAQAHSHRNQGWEQFTDRVIEVLNEREKPIIFILWGSPARKKKGLITNPQHKIVESAHPSPLSAYRGFLGSRPFSKANKLLENNGHSSINWQQTH